MPLIGHAAIRSRGTIGGSLAHADPAAELPVVVAALDGRLVARSASGERVIPAREFFRSSLATALAPDELLAEVCLPVPAPRTGAAFVEISRRHGDFALVSAAATVTVDGDGVCRAVSVALGAVGPTPVVAEAMVVAPLRGTRPDDGALREAARRAAEGLTPDADLHASSEYRREVAAVLVRRALGRALARALGERG